MNFLHSTFPLRDQPRRRRTGSPWLIIAFLWMVLSGGTAWAQSYYSCTFELYSSDNDATHNGFVSSYGRWNISPSNSPGTWYRSEETVSHLSDSLLGHSVAFLSITNFYALTNWTVVLTATTTFTNFYSPYTNNLAVVVTGITTSASATWQLAGPGEYANSSTYPSNLFTNTSPSYSKILSPIPTGTYSISFNSVRGHQSPATTNVNITGGPADWYTTNTYIPYSNSLSVAISGVGETDKVVWSVSCSDNSNWTNMLSSGTTFTNTGTTAQTLSMIPTGTYTVTFNTLSGYTNYPFTITTNITGALTPTVTGNYYSSASTYTLNVYIGPPFDRQGSLDGIGGGTCLVAYASTINTQSVNLLTVSYEVPAGETVTLTATSATNYVYKWYRTSGGHTDVTNISYSQAFDSSYSFQMSADYAVWLLYSRPFHDYDHAGDIDQDELPDRWEYAKFGDSANTYDTRNSAPMAENTSSNKNTTANPDLDFIPSTSTNLVASVIISTNNVTTCTFSGDGKPSYPLQHDQLLQHLKTELPLNGAQLGYSKGVAFDNRLECRGFDMCYLTNGPSGWVPNDDPLTDPTKFDTFPPASGSGISDGWKYYFWYWRSADAFSAGFTNSANLTNNFIRTSSGIYMDEGMVDSDGDDFYDSEEYDYWTDPTHCDTDGDGMDDYWEINNILPSASSNALDYANNLSNPDGDFMASAWGNNQGVLTYGMVGTAFGTNACWSGGTAVNPSNAWIEIYTNTGANVFDLYKDTILKATALTNHTAGTRYGSLTNYYGTSAGLTSYKDGYPVWVDVDNNGTYSLGDYAIVNPRIKHDGVYRMAPAAPYPGVCSFDPRTAWTNITSVSNGVVTFATNTIPYTTYQEYLGGDYLGRISWDAGGKMISPANDSKYALNRNSYSDPQNQDTDGDLMPDGWELYVGLDDNNPSDAGADPDDDKLSNLGEWANATHPLGTCRTTWSNKLLPTDPGAITAPQPNDPHPKDTDWDGVTDAAEQTPNSNPTSWDTDKDHLPDGWEIYAGTSVTNADARMDPDGDGLLNWQEYWCGTVPEWMLCNPDWQDHIYFCCRRAMPWDPIQVSPATDTVFIPPDYISDPCFMYVNGVYTNLGYLRTNYPAANAWSTPADPLTGPYYHTPFAGPVASVNNDSPADSDGDNMDDYWEVYHGLNPCRGNQCLVIDYTPRIIGLFGNVDSVDADPATPGYQFGLEGSPFNSLLEYIQYVEPFRNDPLLRITAMQEIVGPFNFGLNGMDTDGDGLPNLEEYSYNSARTFYHTDPSPIWRTDQNDTNSFIRKNYTFDMAPLAFLSDWEGGGHNNVYPFEFDAVEGYDTDNDGVSDYAEINSSAGQTGNNPLDDRNPIRNRALYVNGTNDFARQVSSRARMGESDLTRFCVEAWIKPDNPSLAGNHVVLEKGGLYNNPLNPGNYIVGANFRMGIVSNGLPYVLYNGRGSLRSYQATARTAHRITSNTNWTHIAGSYDGTNLTIYVNGEESYSSRSTELPANGFNSWLSSNLYSGTAQTLMVGARDNYAGYSMFYAYPSPADYFGGCIDEVRVWNGARTRGEILANKDRRLSQSDITNSAAIGVTNIYNYFTFDDVPDPNRTGETIYPAGMADISSDMHPAIAWWRNYAMHSTVYTGITNSYNYIVYADDNAWHSRATSPAYDDYYHFSTNYSGTNVVQAPAGYLNPGNPYHQNMWNENFIYDLLLFRGTRSVATNSWLSGLSSDPDSTDSDGDGLPDWWEQLHNLDPNDANGANGAWGDADNDGLDNRAEYLAGTDPRNSDTDGDGIGDYDSRSGPYHRTWGEMYMDGDGMPDTWEIQYGLDPYHYDANLDLDGDGWSNLSEYQAGTNPNDSSSHPTPIFGGRIEYAGNLTNGLCVIAAYQTNTMDGAPAVSGTTGQGGAPITAYDSLGMGDGTTKIYSGQLQHGYIVKGSVRVIRYSHTFVCPEYDFGDDTSGNWILFTSYTASVPANDYVKFDYITGAYTFTWPTGSPNTWNAPWNGDTITIRYQWQDVSADTFQITGIKEGEVYLNGFRDVNNNGKWDAGEPMGVSQDQPFYMDWSTPGNMEIKLGLSDAKPGYGRFTWTGSTTGTSDYPVVINKISEQNAPTVLTRTMRWPRNVFHEWDYQLAGYYGFSNGHYQWWMNGQQGTFNITWPASVSTPYLVYPRGDQFNYARNQLKWTMDANSTRYHLQVARKNADSSLTFVVDQYYPTPYCDRDGVYQTDLPKYAGELGDGVYYWRVASWNPAGESAWSDQQTFAINLSSTNSHWIAGDIYYFGKADSSNIIVEAFDNKGFSGKPEARILLNPTVSRTNAFKGSFTLRGLEAGAYYVRAYLDVTPAGGARDDKRNSPWESWGFIRDPNNDYQPRTISLLDTTFLDGTKLVIRDQDTDNDLLPDAWEMYYFGNLDQTGDMDYDGDGETNLEEYMNDGYDLNPASWDSDGDGLSDCFEINYTAPSFGYSAKSGIQLNPSKWDTDGDGYSDGAELKRYHTDPLNPSSYPRYRPMCFDAARSPGDYDGDGRSDLTIYDAAEGNWYLMTAAGFSFSLPFGSATTLPMLGDYTGDGCDEFSLFDSSTGDWHLYDAWTAQSFSMRFGDSEMIPVPGDYTGDGKTDLAVYYPAQGTWFICNIWNGLSYTFTLGGPTWTPVPGDYNGDGGMDLAVYEAASGNWQIFACHLYTHESQYLSGNFGGPTMIPVPGDYDGDGRNDIAMFDTSTANWYILTWKGQFLSGQFGCYGCIPVAGDYDGDGRTDVCVYYPPTGIWYILCWSGQSYQAQFGYPAATPALKGRM